MNGSDWCQTLIVSSSNSLMTLGLAGLVVSMTTPCESAAEYARVPDALKVMSWDSVPSPGRAERLSSPACLGTSGSRTSMISIAGWIEVISSEFEL